MGIMEADSRDHFEVGQQGEGGHSSSAETIIRRLESWSLELVRKKYDLAAYEANLQAKQANLSVDRMRAENAIEEYKKRCAIEEAKLGKLKKALQNDEKEYKALTNAFESAKRDHDGVFSELKKRVADKVCLMRENCSQVLQQIASAASRVIQESDRREREAAQEHEEEQQKLRLEHRMLLLQKRKEARLALMLQESEFELTLEAEEKQARTVFELEDAVQTKKARKLVYGEEIERYRARGDQLNAAVQKSIEDIAAREARLAESREKVDALEQSCRKKQIEVRMTEKRIDTLTKRIASLKGEIDKMRIQLREGLQSSVRERKNLQPSLKEVQRARREVEEEKVVLKKDEAVLEKELAEVESLRQKLQEKERQVEKKRTMLKTRSREMATTMAETEQEMHDRQAQVDQLLQIAQPYASTVVTQAEKLTEWRNGIIESEERVKQQEREIEAREQKLANYCQPFDERR
eukprot:jgi/Bigna1/67753/fgenesh1_pg.4_\